MFKLSFITLALLLSINILAIQSPHGANLGIKCDVCHTTGGWTKIKLNSFNHDQTGFPLVGQHKIQDCKKCHIDLVFSNAKTKCNSCHTDVHQQTVGQDCERCHTPSSWIVQNVKAMHDQTKFPLRGQHTQVDCYQCHKSASLLRFDPMRSECVDCHLKDYNATTSPSHVASKYSTDCLSCHDEKTWFSATFDHNTTGFPLNGGHLGVECIKCHANGYAGTSSACASCHMKNFNATTNPNHTAAKFSTDCQTCHNVTAWQPSTFNHNTTAFPLTGSHVGVDCIKCHAGGYVSTPSTCVSCHQTNFNATTNPNHTAAKFSTDCQTCHNVTAWQPSTFNHNTTSFPLTGSHIGVACVSCHTNGYTGGTPTTCVGCHLPNYNATTNPNHATNKFSTDCQTCHNVTAWQPSTFNHNSTAFPLTGSHTGVDCIKCHAGGYVSTPSTCVSCHQTNYNATTNPNHATNKFSTDCQTCHNVTAWQPSTFNHNTTSFPLTGSHIGVACVSCHTNGYTGGTPTTCVGCHLPNYNATTNPNHATNKFSTDCQTCHNIIAWKPSTFNHSTTAFPLTGSHTGVDCIKCHAAGYVSTPSTCVSCHQTNYNVTTNPNHATNKFSTDCQTCHNVTAWQPSTFNHNTTVFPLTGSHTGVACVTCHTNGYTGGTPTTCVGCHLPNYNTATNPNHATNKFSTDCQTCHNVTAWQPSTFNHNTTSFPLTGSHIGVACVTCHTNGYTGGTPTTCVGCHLPNYNATTNPNHITAKFSTDCSTCHNVTAWSPAPLFNHNTATTFSLTGAHIGVACISCHTNGYKTIPTTCVSCHLTDYNAATNPIHKTNASVFTTNCTSCHNVNAWSPAPLFNHTSFFPIKSGKHNGVACATCHTNSANYMTFTCITTSCHRSAHNRSQGSNGCYSCHPKGVAD